DVLGPMRQSLTASDGKLYAPEAPVVRHREQSPPEPAPTAPAELPRRAPGASGITEVLVPPVSGTGWKGFFRLRHGTAG
ncbi:hypothetical protein ACWDZ8_39440, partial [Streptomyces sp. NPDC003233]